MKKQSKHTIEDRLFRNHDQFQQIDAAQDWQKVREKMGFSGDQRTGNSNEGLKIRRFWTAAAILLAILGIGYLTRNAIFGPEEMLIASTGDAIEVIHLPDGSVVNLNRNSELIYPERFGRKSRSVSFNGEGYFEIAKNPEYPFIVNVAGRATVEVLGTSFNINALPASDSVKVHVLEGRVAFFTSVKRDPKTILGKDEQATLRDGKISQEKTVEKNFLSWKTGVLRFDQEPLDKVLNDLGKYYNRMFILEGTGLNELRFTSTIDNQELEDVLEEIGLILGLGYTVEKDRVILHRPD